MLPVFVEVLHSYDPSLFLQIVHEESSDCAVIKFGRVSLSDDTQCLAKSLGFNDGSWSAEFIGGGINEQFSERRNENLLKRSPLVIHALLVLVHQYYINIYIHIFLRIPKSRIIVNTIFVIHEAVVLHERQTVTIFAEFDARSEQIRPWQFTESSMGFPITRQFTGNGDRQCT